jgi:hypothetical protein
MTVSSYRQINEFKKDTSGYANSKFKHEEQKLDKNNHLLGFDTTGTCELTLLHTIKQRD